MKKIISEKEYNAIMARIDELVEIVEDNTPKDNKDYKELDILADLAVAYEKEHFPVTKPTLTEILKLRMYEMNLTQKGLSELIGVSPSRISEILSGKSEPTFQMARTISKTLHIDADIVLGV